MDNAAILRGIRIIESRTVGAAFLALSVLAAARGLLELLRIFPWYLRGTMDSDVLLYFAVGRGILNGLSPYMDLFETKPPGMFLLSALSLRATGDERLLGVLSIVCLIIIAAIPVFCAIAWTSRESDRVRRATVVAIAMAGGALIALYLERWATGMETELFAGAALGLYVLTLVRPPRRARIALFLRSLLLFVAVFLKEYEIFMAFAAALLIAENPRDLIRSFVLPIIFALAAFAVALLMLGVFLPYATVYLPVILFFRMTGNIAEPVWLRAMDVSLLPFHFWVQFTESRLFGLLVFSLIALFPILPRHRMPGAVTPMEPVSWKTVAWAAAAWAILVVFVGELQILALWTNVMLREGVWITKAYPHALAPIALVTAALLAWILRRKRALLPRMMIALAAFFAVQYAIVSAGAAGNHFAAAVPVYLILVLLALRFIARNEHDPAASRDPGRSVELVPALLVILSLLFYRTSADDWNRLRENAVFAPRHNAELIERLDTLMDRCGVERYYDLTGLYTFAFARHSPWGPIPYLRVFDYLLNSDHPLARATEENLAKRNLLLLAPLEIANPRTRGFVETHFTRAPPPCAAGILPLETRETWFRTGVTYKEA